MLAPRPEPVWLLVAVARGATRASHGLPAGAWPELRYEGSAAICTGST
jgi:hypothetical protein